MPSVSAATITSVTTNPDGSYTVVVTMSDNSTNSATFPANATSNDVVAWARGLAAQFNTKVTTTSLSSLTGAVIAPLASDPQ